ncbi:Carboxypeptidase [Mycena venus]|uniref:Carboxypeptidase n=1 Tax=Mycena venus TaxID=2733690 RepID=A0A8H6Y0M3_9AGAR|nr:Carboxypeptidase [Mycena venus]
MQTTLFGPDWQNCPYILIRFEYRLCILTFPARFRGHRTAAPYRHDTADPELCGQRRREPCRPSRIPNATLFWVFEKSSGSLRCDSSTDPWIIWLNGGPGGSSMIRLLTENGPIKAAGSFSIGQNNFSWNQLADMIWVDQPGEYIPTWGGVRDFRRYGLRDEDQIGEDFVGFLSNLVKIFPSLATHPLYLMGESYAGTYILYITKTIFSTANPPVTLRKIAVGDGALGSNAVFEELPTISTIETYPQLINYDPEVYEYFKTQEHLYGYDLNLTYPQNRHFPTLVDPFTTLANPAPVKSSRYKLVVAALKAGQATRVAPSKRELERREERRATWKRDLAGPTLDPTYGCFLFLEMWDYAFNFTFPWSLGGVDLYNIPDALNPDVPGQNLNTSPRPAEVYMNDAAVRAALHAPTSKD